MPVPWTSDCSAPRRSKGRNSRAILSADSPGPVSVTTIATRPPAAAWQATRMVPTWRLYGGYGTFSDQGASRS
jgi:hypothetical protein